ncbi:heme oxygenase [Chryseobacterium sp. MEBOG06]|uniref:heme oxygenase n=1 Tax=unclassified Chryseobacterium TaxID=2593645 RepID=UPI001F272899|nr:MULTISPECIES: heme oxygenase [unclassified Chryseobacterium]UKB82078.1 heme oxygenase [Chryseobacterium sp. MEBOG06]
MKTIHLFQFKNSFSRNISFFKEERRLKTDLAAFDLIDIEIVTEYIVKTHDDFTFEGTSVNDLILMCKRAQKTIEHYFVAGLNDYDVI